ncbi:MAG: VOC family protein [Deltaproteobacteria bacterium]|nr:VOC family protein [Deltaproteobacteria bacterium]
MPLGSITPILRIFDEEKAIDFYVAYLGFTIDWRHRFSDDHPLYVQASRDGCVIHLSEHHGDATPGAAIRIRTDALDAFRAELKGRRSRFVKPSIKTAPWGERSMSFADPFGNRLTFFEPRAAT